MLYISKSDLVKYISKRQEILRFELKQARRADNSGFICTRLEAKIDEVDLMMGHIVANLLPTIDKDIDDVKSVASQ